MSKKSMDELDEKKAWLSASDAKFKPIEEKIIDYRRFYRGDQWRGMESINVGYRVVENLIFANIRTIIPRLNFKNPKIYVTPKKKPYTANGKRIDTLKAAVAMEILMNYYYNQLQVKREADRCLLDALLGPWGIMEIGYTVTTEKVKGVEEFNELIKEDEPFITRVSPLDFRVDSLASDSHLHDARWVAKRWVKSLDDIKANTFYSGTKGLRPNFTVDSDSSGDDDTREKPMSWGENSSVGDGGLWDRVEGWDLYDKRDRKLFVIVKDHDKFLYNDAWPAALDKINGFPFETIYMNENPDKLYPVADIDVYRSLQEELNLVRSYMIDHIKRISQRRYLARKDALQPEAMAALLNGGDGTVVEVEGSISETVVALPDAAISQDIYMIANLLKSSIREMAGVSGMEALSSQKYEQATEPALIERASQTIKDFQRATFEDFVVRIVKKLAGVLQETLEEASIPIDSRQMSLARQYTPTKIEQVVGKDATILSPWLNLNREDIIGDYEFAIEAGSTQPVDEQKRKKDAIMLYQMLVKDPMVNGRELRIKLLEDIGIAEPEKLLKTPEQMKQEKMQQMKAMQMKMQAEDGPKRQVDMEKAKMKAETARAQAQMQKDTEDARLRIEAENAMTKRQSLYKP